MLVILVKLGLAFVHLCREENAPLRVTVAHKQN